MRLSDRGASQGCGLTQGLGRASFCAHLLGDRTCVLAAMDLTALCCFFGARRGISALKEALGTLLKNHLIKSGPPGNLLYSFTFVELGKEPKSSHMLDKHH